MIKRPWGTRMSDCQLQHLDSAPLGADLPRAGALLPRLLCLAVIVAMASGCAHRVWNQPIGDLPTGDRYEFRNRLPDNSPELFVVLAFSGGGTRAASFSYGVLETLRDTPVRIDGHARRLLDEVDVITSVSGGSYTAAYYGLFGDRLFSDFRPSFLYRDWQGELGRLLLRPGSLAKLPLSDYNRSDLVAAYLDKTLLEGRTYRDMSRGNLPFVIVNASDINNATTFSFIQQQFDFLCADLGRYPVANAVMASSALPGPFASIGLRNFGDCPQRRQPWVAQALADDPLLARRHTVALALQRYADPARMPILRLVDGGVTDNLGVRGSMMSPVAHYGNVPDMAGAFTPERLRKVRHVLVIVANAETYPEADWSRSGAEPGLVDVLRGSFDAALGILNTETLGLARNEFLMWQDHVNAMRGPDEAKVEVHFAILTFAQIADPAERSRFNAMPTTFRLQSDAVDALVAKSRHLLDASPEFHGFLRSVRQAERARVNAAD
jgi:NTE family protein